MTESTKDQATLGAEIGRLAMAVLKAVEQGLSEQEARDLEGLLQDPAWLEDYRAMQKLIRSLPLFASDALLQHLAERHPALAVIFGAVRQVAPEPGKHPADSP